MKIPKRRVRGRLLTIGDRLQQPGLTPTQEIAIFMEYPNIRRGAAFHEAGHCVSAILTGNECTFIAINVDGKLGSCLGLNGIVPSAAWAPLHGSPVSVIAGPVAEVRAVGILPTRAHDIANHQRAVIECGFDLQAVTAAAQQLLDDNWITVCALAEAVLVKYRLDARDIDDIMRRTLSRRTDK